MADLNPFSRVDPNLAAYLGENPDANPFAAVDPELAAFLERNPDIKLGQETETGPAIKEPFVVPGTGDLATDVTDELRAYGNESGPRDYNYYYGNRPENVSTLTRLGANLADVRDAFASEPLPPTEAQLSRDEADLALSTFIEDMTAFYDKAPTAAEVGLDNPALTGGGDVKVDIRLVSLPDGTIEEQYIRIPDPSSDALGRSFSQAYRNVVQQIGGLAQGNIVSESEFEKRIPDFEADGLEQLATDLITFGVPGLGAERLAGTALKGLRGLKYGRTGIALGRTAATALSDAIMTTKGDEGMIISPEMVSNSFLKIQDPEAAASVAMFMDGMILNGAFDTILYGIGKAASYGADRLKGIRGVFDPSYIRDKSQRQAMLNVLTMIDPELAGANSSELKRNLLNLATVMDANAQSILQIGETTVEINFDSLNALARGAEQYINASRIGMKRGMTEEAWSDYVSSEARNMVERMVGVVRSQEGSPILRQAAVGMTDAIDRGIMEESDRLLRATDEVPNPLRGGAEALVDQRAADIAAATQRAADADRSVAAIKDRLGRAVELDPFIRDLLASDDPLTFFNNTDQIDRVRQLLGGSLFNDYTEAWSAVRNAYGAIPNDPIGPEAMSALKQALDDAIAPGGRLDLSDATTRSVLAPWTSRLQPRRGAGQLGPLDDPQSVAPIINIETTDQLVDRLGNDLGFQDLMRFKQDLEALYRNSSDPGVRQRISDLKNHITDPESGQLAFVIESGGEAADLAQEADRLFVETKNRFSDAEPLRRFSDVAAERRAGLNTPTPEGLMPRGQADLDVTSLQILPQAANEPTGAYYEKLRKAFSDPANATQLDNVTADLYVAEGLRNLSLALRQNDSQSADLIISSFQNQAKALRESGSPLYAQLEEAAVRIERLQAELGDDLLVAEAAAEQAQEGLVAANNKIVGRFLNEYGPGVTDNVQQTVTSIMSQANAGDAVTALMAQIDRLPDSQREATRQAFQGAILRGLRSKLFGSTPIGMSTATSAAVEARMGALQAITDETANSVLSGVRAAFKDKPEVVEGVEFALSELGTTNSYSRLKIARAGSDTAANAGVREAVSTGILFAFGYMNPTAAAARRLSKAQVDQLERMAEQTRQNAMVAILAAPEEFAYLARAVARKEVPSELDLARNIFLDAAKAGLRYQIRVNPSDASIYELTLLAIEGLIGAGQQPEGFEE